MASDVNFDVLTCWRIAWATHTNQLHFSFHAINMLRHCIYSSPECAILLALNLLFCIVTLMGHFGVSFRTYQFQCFSFSYFNFSTLSIKLKIEMEYHLGYIECCGVQNVIGIVMELYIWMIKYVRCLWYPIAISWLWILKISRGNDA